MSRSLYKGNFLKKNVLINLNDNSQVFKKEIKIWHKESRILPIFLNKVVSVYNGAIFLPLQVSKPMIGYKFGDFIYTRKSNQFEKWNTN